MRVKAGHQGATRPASKKAHRHTARLASTICQSIQRPAAAFPESERQTLAQWPALGRSNRQPLASSHHLTANGSMQQPTRQVACRVAAVTEFPNYKTSIVEVPRGETAGATMVVENVTLQAGDRDLMEEVNWRVLPGQRWGLVGANGCGKSTLIRALCGIRPVDTGRLIVAPKVEVGFLAQTAVSGSTRTVWQEARSQMTTLLAAEAQIEAAQRELEKGNPGAAEELAAAQDAYIMAGGADSDKRITNVLNGLGFRMEQFHVPATQFSGGWQMRIALARLLLGEAGQAAAAGTAGGLMLLDEPTNHLDSAAIKWLGSFLRASGGTLVVVSHDEALLEDVCDHIAEVRGKKLHTYTGSFSKFLQQRAERESQAIATAAAQQMEIDRLEGFVKRFGAKASKASSAQSKQKLADKLKAEMVDVPTAASTEGGGDYTKVTLKLPRAPPCFTDVLVLKDASIGWGSQEVPGAKPIVSGVELVVKKGQRVLVLGPNGAGKSTLLKALSGSIPLWGGTRKEGDGVKLGVFSQDLAQDLPLDKTALQYVEQMARAHDPNTTLVKCRQALGALGLTNSLALQPIGVLSGGEKARVALAAFALVPSNVLLLDEASNHLDAATIKVLTGALQDFQGAIVAITHNRAFAESLNATHVLRVQDGKATLSGNMGLTDADFEHGNGGVAAAKGGARIKERNTPGGKAKRGTRSGSESGSSRDGTPSPLPTRGYSPAPAARNGTPTPPPSKNGAAAATKSKRTTLAWTEQQEYQRLGKEVANLTEQRDALQDKVAKLAKGSDFKALETSSLELAKIAEKVDKLEMRWLELAELAGDI